MALDENSLKANETLKDLSPEQIAAITTLSANDENTVIGKKIGEHHGLIEKDVKEVSGIEKLEGEKSYDYMKRVMGEFKTQATEFPTLKSTVETQKATIADLQKKITDGSTDEAVKQQLADAKAKLSQMETKYSTDKSEWETKYKEKSSEVTNLQISTEFNGATSGLKFKPGYTETIQKTLVNAAKSTILAKYTPDWVKEGGNTIMVFRDSDNEIARNPANKLEPFTASELVQKELGEALDAGNKGGGGTGEPGGAGGANPEILDLSSAKTQVEADKLIEKHLMAKGLKRGDKDFAEAKTKLRTDNGVAKMDVS